MGKSIEFEIGSVELTISFDTIEELKTALGQLEEIKKVLKENLPEASTEATTTLRKDLEGIMDYHNGELIIIRAPDTKVKKVSLMLYALGATGATPGEITTVTGVGNPSKSVLHDRSYRKYFRKVANGRYVLTDVGLTLVTSTILPELRGGKANAQTQY